MEQTSQMLQKRRSWIRKNSAISNRQRRTRDSLNSCEFSYGTRAASGALRRSAPRRSGLSLLEILVSVFVLSIGLMGVAAIIPLGHHQIVEATKSDRAAACGQAGLHEVKVRGWLNPTGWRWLAGVPSTILVTDIDGDGIDDGAIRMRDSFAIDPLFFSHQDYGNQNNALTRQFPLDATTAATVPLVRVTINQVDNSVMPPVYYPMPFATANRIFTWRDDMLFPIPDEPEDRPRQFVMWDGGQGVAYPLRTTDVLPVSPAPTSPVMSQADDNYSWMATVTPILDGPGHDFWFPALPSPLAESHAYISQITRYTVSIVVFYKRNFECPDLADLYDPEFLSPERSVEAVFPGDGYGGGDVLLQIDPAGSKPETWLNVKKNGWLMLRGLERVDLPDPAGPAFVARTVAKWYRVVAVDDEIVDCTLSSGAAGRGRYVTLSGPDWRVDTDGNGTFNPPANDPAIATLVDDVIGVYTTTVEADYGSVWTQ